MNGRRIALAFVLVLALGGAVAAFGGHGASRLVDPVAAAASKTESAGGERAAMDVELTGPAGKSYEIEAKGTFDRNEGELTVDLSNLLQETGLPAGAGSGVEIRYLQENGDPVIYVDIPSLASIIPGGKRWLRLDLATAAKSLGLNLDQILDQTAQNPEQALELLRATGEVDEVGPAVVNGVATTEYSGTIELAKAAELTGESGIESLVAHLESQGLPSSIPVQVWIDGNGLVRQLALDETLSAGGQKLGVAVTLDISDYGATVSVSAPPASEVFDLSGLVSQALSNLATSAGPTTTTG